MGVNCDSYLSRTFSQLLFCEWRMTYSVYLEFYVMLKILNFAQSGFNSAEFPTREFVTFSYKFFLVGHMTGVQTVALEQCCLAAC